MSLFGMLNLLQVMSYFRETLQERSAGTYLKAHSQWKKSPCLKLSSFGLWSVVFLNFWLVVIRVENFLGRGGSWWLVVAHGGSWWLVVAQQS